MTFYMPTDTDPRDPALFTREEVEVDALVAYMEAAGRPPSDDEVETYVAANFVCA